MGYDMRWENDPPPEFTARHDQARAAFDAAVKARDAHPRGSAAADALQPEVERAYAAMDEADIGYFRLNIWGMGTARDELYAAGVITDADQPPLPVDEDDEQLWEIWRTQIVPGDSHGIPSYKVGSNDGWLVTPSEIRTGLAWADHQDKKWETNLTDYVNEWVQWMKQAVEMGGFRVY